MTAFPVVRDQSAAYSLLDLIQGSVITQAIAAAAKLGIADVLADGPLPATEIAQRVGSDPDATGRLLRALSGCGIFAVLPDGRFELTPMADALRESAPDSMRGMAILMGHPMLWEEWTDLITSVRTGKESLPQRRGMETFDFFTANPEYANVFFEGFRALSASETEPVLAAYDFSQFGTVVDIGGGRGGLLAAILTQAPGTRGVLVESGQSAAEAPQVLAEAGVADRASVETGTYFDALPAGADGYVLKHILHDFKEPECIALLKNVRKAAAPGSKVLVIEYVLEGNNERHLGNVIDLWLLLLLGARERTLPEYTEMFAAAGLQVVRAVPTSSPLSIIEAVAV